MRLKHIWSYVPLPTYVKTFWERITFTRLTVIYLTFSVLHFLVQLALQIRAFTINAHAFQVGINLVQQGNSSIKGLPFYSNSTLYSCNWVPSNLDHNGCTVVWPKPHQDNIGSQQDNMSPYNSPSSTNLLTSSDIFPTVLTTSVSSSTSVSIISPSASQGPVVSGVEIIVNSQPATGSSSVPVVPSAQSSASSQPPLPSLTTEVRNTAIFTTIIVSPPSITPDLTSPRVSSTTQSSLPFTTTIITNGAAGGRSGSDDDDDGESDDDDDDGDNGGPTVPASLGVLRRHHTNIMLSPSDLTTCVEALSYPLSILGNTKREDVVFMAFQFWVLGMSVVALLNESIPHIFASLLTHVMATAWGGYQIDRTASFRSQFNTLITRGACAGISTDLPIGPAYWETRKAAEISSLVLNIIALLVSCFLSWRLFKLFGWQTFKRVGASLVVNRMYKLVLVLSIALQLSLFFMTVTVSLWLDRLINNVIGDLASLRKLYMASCIITLVLLIPWLMMGWFGVRRELRIQTLMFLILCVAYLGGWGVMFVSTTFRWTFITWSFFSMISVISVVLTVTCLILGLLCRMNFGKGLLRYLQAQEALPGGDFGIVTPESHDDGYNDEKVEFPSTENPMPTFNATYGNDFPAHGHVFITNGPRFFNQSPQPQMAVGIPQRALTRTPSNRSTDSYSSEKSYASGDSLHGYSHSRSDSGNNGHSKRWVIE